MIIAMYSQENDGVWVGAKQLGDSDLFFLDMSLRKLGISELKRHTLDETHNPFEMITPLKRDSARNGIGLK